MKHAFVRLFLFGLMTISSSALAQRNNGLEAIEPDLEKMNLEFLMPVENQYKFSQVRKNEFVDYDSRMVARSGQMEIFIAVHPVGEGGLTSFYPHLEYQRLLANLVPNDDDQNVLVIGWREPKLRDRNADWGAESYFTARKEITAYPYTKFIAFYREDYGMVVMLYCFNKPDRLPELLRFREKTEE